MCKKGGPRCDEVKAYFEALKNELSIVSSEEKIDRDILDRGLTTKAGREEFIKKYPNSDRKIAIYDTMDEADRNLGRENKTWRKTEKECLEILQTHAPSDFCFTQTANNSQLSDIRVERKKNNGTKDMVGYIEAKLLPSAAGGQIIVNRSTSSFEPAIYSPENQRIVDIINRHNVGRGVLNLNKDEEQEVQLWLRHHWQEKNIKGFYLSDKSSNFSNFVTLDELKDFVDVRLHHPRLKRRGSKGIISNDENKGFIKNQLLSSGIHEYDFSQESNRNLTIVARNNQEISKIRSLASSKQVFKFGEDLGLVKLSYIDNEFRLRKLSKINELTIIMNLKPKKNLARNQSRVF